MKNNLLFATILMTMAGCQPSTKKESSVSDNVQTYEVFDIKNSATKRDIPLSNLLDNFEIVHFDKADNALFKPGWTYFSDNYIGIRQYGGPVKIFDKKGKFLTDVGAIGQGPGEYQSIYDVLIDEKNGNIYIAPFVNGNILQYDMQGKFIREIDFSVRLNKPKISMQPDKTLSLINLYFRENGGKKLTSASVQLNNNDKLEYLYSDCIASNLRNPEGQTVGYNTETWAFRNVPEFSFSTTQTDTLFHYDHKDNKLIPKFVFKKDPAKEGAFYLPMELPNHYFVTEYLNNKNEVILIEKENNEGYFANIVNDYLGNIHTPMFFQDGYFFYTSEPAELQEKLEEHLESGKCPDDQKEKLQKLADSLNPNDNNVLLMGKLKQ